MKSKNLRVLSGAKEDLRRYNAFSLPLFLCKFDFISVARSTRLGMHHSSVKRMSRFIIIIPTVIATVYFSQIII